MDLLSELQHAEFKEAFDEFDKVSLDVMMLYYALHKNLEFWNKTQEQNLNGEQKKEKELAALTVRIVAE